MDANQYILLGVIVLSGVISVFAIYFIVLLFMNRSTKKKEKIKDIEITGEERNLEEEMNKMVREEIKVDPPLMLKKEDTKPIQNASVIKDNAPVNPFGVDLTSQNDEEKNEAENEFNVNNRYFN